MEFIKNLIEGFNFYFVPAALICVPVHEYAHGYVAWKLGDPTAKQSGRLTLNPLRHFDPVGVVLLILFGFGWARPVPVDTRYFKNPKRDMAITSLAGPLSNFVLAFLMLVLLSASIRIFSYSAFVQFLINLMLNIALLSIGLGVFNLLPIPPLDGSKILFSFLPERIYYTILRYERYGMIIMIAIIYLGLVTGPLNTVRIWTFNKLLYLADLPFRLIEGLF
ncbi:MAG: site-2 protease family protein [Clostridiales bacterium]|nr:site-2 protease family protein [Clostridiales bacterium]